MIICDNCMMDLVVSGEAVPHIQIFGPNGTRWRTTLCEMCKIGALCVERNDIVMSPESNPQEETWNPPMNADDYQKSALRTMADQNKIRVRNYYGLDKSDEPMNIDRVKLVQLDNAARGMAGDVGEVNSCVQKCLEYGQQLDLVNLKEELGDVLWRITQACDAVGFTLEEVMQANIKKLAKRYPDKYSDFLAAEENRDREVERQVISEMPQIGDPYPTETKEEFGWPEEQNGQGFAEPKEEADV